MRLFLSYLVWDHLGMDPRSLEPGIPAKPISIFSVSKPCMAVLKLLTLGFGENSREKKDGILASLCLSSADVE
eukprot:4219913-Ditylum_brightwellii.AAC.1